jgi:acetylglutamate kinase
MPKSARSDPAKLAEISKTLAEALPFMRQFSGQTFVIKFGGHAMGDDDLAVSFAEDIVMLRQVGIHPVVVHGGGPQIGKMLARLNIESAFIDGLRVTDRTTVDIVEMVLSGSINKQIVDSVHRAGGTAIGLSGKDGRLIEARQMRRTTRDPDSNIEKILDLGFVGEPVTINTKALDVLRQSDIIPIIAPIGVGPKGQTYNINADTAAGAIAGALGASKLLMLTDIAGVLDADKEVMPTLSKKQATQLMKDGVITGGMIPKVETCLEAVRRGTSAVHILDGRIKHVLLLEVFTEHGVGTMIRADD